MCCLYMSVCDVSCVVCACVYIRTYIRTRINLWYLRSGIIGSSQIQHFHILNI